MATSDNLHGTDLSDASTMSSYLASFSDNDVYRYALQYPYAINVFRNELGNVCVSADGENDITKWRPNSTITVTVEPGTKIGWISVKDADANTVSINSTASGYTFTMPQRDVDINICFELPDWPTQGTGTEDDPNMKKVLFAVFAAAVLLMGTTGCSKADDPSPIDIEALEKSLVGLWWDEYEYADVTETGVPFSRVLLAVIANADHTGCIYLGVFNDTSDEPLAIYGGPKDAAFTWHLLANGTLLLGDPVTGETYALARTRAAGGSSYGDGMTDVSKTSLTYTDGSVTMTNDDYSGTLDKADAETAAEIEEKLSPATGDEDVINPGEPNRPAGARSFNNRVPAPDV